MTARIVVQAPGLLTTVQDGGRCGCAHLGISAGGAADPVALRLGNRLVGNSEYAAALEITLAGGTLLFPEGGTIAITGSDFGPALDGVPLPLWTSCGVRAGQALSLGRTRGGARCYLCASGGIAVKPFFGSASTHLAAGFGGFQGRALRAGDVLETGPASPLPERRTIPSDVLSRLSPRKVLRATAGPQADWFTADSVSAFFGTAYCVTEEANRTGLRLAGAPVHAREPGRMMITEGVSAGAVQAPAGGQPIILFVDQQTTGGYPKIANVIAADLASLGQLRPRDEIRFEPVSPPEARALLLEQERILVSCIP